MERGKMTSFDPQNHAKPPAALNLQRGQLLIVGTGAISVTFLPSWVNVRRTWYPQMSIRVVLTHSATALVSTRAIAAISGHSVAVQDGGASSPAVMHRALSAWADLVLVFPATSNFLNKLAHSMTDSMALMTCAVSPSPVVLVPSVPEKIWKAPSMVRNISLLKESGYWVHEPSAAVTAATRTGEFGGPADISSVVRLMSKTLETDPNTQKES